ncbi:heavy metal translocating P-type ATPase [Kiritimatiellota bacterium B12222]|nr:heavy metal translocating P-type ATPase [Kiritimatiellota bacterium B12222]
MELTHDIDENPRWESGLMILCGISLVAGFTLEHVFILPPIYHHVAWTIAYLTGGYFGVVESFESLRKGKVDVDLLMVLAALGAAYVDHPFEGAMLLFLFSLSNVLQNFAMERSRNAIQSLMKLRPDEINCLVNGQWKMCAVAEVQPGTRVLVKPGESIALDGKVISGQSAVDEASLTGESLPVSKTTGDMLFSGTVNQSGSLEYEVTKCEAESTLSKIISMVENAQSEKASSQRFLEKAEQYYAMGVILFTLGLIFVPWKVLGRPFNSSFYQAMTVMVVASPCALIISTPAAFLSAIGGAARKGVLFKGGVHLERMAAIKILAFDKTGTLTRGEPTVTEILSLSGESEDAKNQLLRKLAIVEAHSEHPLAEAVLKAAHARDLEISEPLHFQSIQGKGASATVENQALVAGSLRYFEEENVRIPEETLNRCHALQDQGHSLILLAEQNDSLHLLGLVALADEIREDAARMIQGLRKQGIQRIAMLTGDHPQVAAHIAENLGIDDVFAGLLPEQKVEKIRELQQQGPVAMVGDGVNDAPALATADLGIAMGAAGTDVAMETADVVLMSTELCHLVNAFALAKRSRRVVAQNLTFSMAVILVLVISTLTVGIPLPLGVIGHEGSTVLVCLNGLRLLSFKSKQKP